jgi:hypothetical protein
MLAALACAISGIFAYRSGERSAKTLALGNAFVWAVANCGWLYSAMWLLPIADWYIGIVATVIYWAAPSGWLRIYINLVAARLVLHVIDYMTGHMFFVPYLHAVNATYAGMVIATAYSGGKDDLRILLHRLRRFRDLLPAPAWRKVSDG